MDGKALLIALGNKKTKAKPKKNQKREDMKMALKDFKESDDPDRQLDALNALIAMGQDNEDG